MKSVKFFIISLILLVVILEGVHIFLSNMVSETSVEVATVRNEIKVLDEKTTSLKTELLQYSSYAHISSRAAELGFQESKDSAMRVNAPSKMARVQ